MKHLALFILLFSQFLILPSAWADDDTDNTGGIWTEVGVSKALPYNLSIDVSLGHRTQDWFKESNRADAGLGLTWKASKHWRLGFGYVFIMKHYPSEVSYKYEEETEFKYSDPFDKTNEIELLEYMGRNYPSDETPTYTYDGYNFKTKNDVRTDQSFWRQRHRVYADVSYTTKFWKVLRISVRERYQMTRVPKKTIDRTRYRERVVTKYRDPSYDGEGNLCVETYNDGESWENGDWPQSYPYEDIAKYWQEGDVIYKDHINFDDEIVENKVDATAEYMATHDPLNTTEVLDHEKRSKTQHILRSRLKLSIDKKGWNWEPYVSVETHNNLGEKWNLDKIRFATGVDYKINRHHEVGIGYIFNHENDDDGNQNIHAISVGYNFKF